MSLQLTTHEKNDVMIVDASGRLALGASTSLLRNKLRELSDGGSKMILLNLAGVTYIDSSGLGELVAAYTTVTAGGGQMKLLNLAKRVHDLLQITKLYTVFETFEDEALAMGSFSVAEPIGLQLQR